jgi:hypothetical protein
MAPPPDEIALRERPRTNQRCPYCHDALEEAGVGEEIPCRSCGTLHHEVCLDELGGCTVLGCQGGKPRPLGSVEEVRARVRERLERFLEHTRRPASPEELERIAREGWQCADCQNRFWSLECEACGALLDRRCGQLDHPCQGCGQKHETPARSAQPLLPAPRRDLRVLLTVGAFGFLGLVIGLLYLLLWAYRESGL